MILSHARTSSAADFDGDGVDDATDNCLIVANADQRDTNADGFGNLCDADVNNDSFINDADEDTMKAVLHSADPDSDLNGDGIVDFLDIGRMKALIPLPPVPDWQPAVTFNEVKSIGGVAQPNQLVTILVDGIDQGIMATQPDGSFSFDVTLLEGPNSISFLASDGNFSGVPSTPFQIIYDPYRGRHMTDPVISGDTHFVLDPAIPYLITGTLLVESGAVLTIHDGTLVHFAPGARIVVDGILRVVGNDLQPVTLTSLSGTPAAGDWQGIITQAGAQELTIDYAFILYADIPVDVVDTAATSISNSTIQDFTTHGVRVTGSGSIAISDSAIGSGGAGSACIRLQDTPGSVTIQGNTVDSCGDGLWLENSSPLVDDNRFELNTESGIEIRIDSAPTLSNNHIVTNDFGIELVGGGGILSDPAPVADGNEFNLNTSANLSIAAASAWTDPQNVSLDFEANYWGTVNPHLASYAILDRRTDYDNLPTVDFVPFADASFVPVADAGLLNGLVTTSVNLAASTTYDVVGAYAVGQAGTLTLPQAVILRFDQAARFDVGGTLLVQGAPLNRVELRSRNGSPLRGDWVGVRLLSSSTASIIDEAQIDHATTALHAIGASSTTVSNSLFQEFEEDAILLADDADAAISNCTFDNTAGIVEGDAIDLDSVAGSVTIQDNTISGVANGVHVRGASTPSITGNEIAGNAVGIYFDVENGEEPSAVITNNRLHTNSSYNLSLDGQSWSSPETTFVDAEFNYWGTTITGDIPLTIFDRNDSSGAPLVDYVLFNDAGGSPVPFSGLGGVVNDTTSPLTASTTYQVISPMVVPMGTTLTVPEGVTLEFLPGGSLTVDGTLTVQGLVGTPATFTSGIGVPSRGDWPGIVITGSSTGSSFDHAIIEYATRGIEIDSPGAVMIDNTTIREISLDGISASNGASLTLTNSLLDNSSGAADGDGIDLNNVTGSVTIQDNEITGLAVGVRVRGVSTASLTGNEIHVNDTGVLLIATCCYNEPSPTITDNQLHSNLSFSVSLGTSGWANPASTIISFANNYWGSVDPHIISLSIHDFSEDRDTPLLDFFPFDDAGGTPVVLSNILFGAINDGVASLVINDSYEVVAPTWVPAGDTLTVPEGVTLGFGSTSTLQIDGTLDVQGVSGNVVTFTSVQGSPARGDWNGILLSSTSTLSGFDYAWVEYATDALAIEAPATASLSNSVIREFSANGVALAGAAGATISDTLIDNASGAAEGNGIDLDEVTGSVTITDSEIRGADNGLYVRGDSSPTVTSGEIWSNLIGVHLRVENGDDPSISLTSSRLHTNTNYNLSTGANVWSAPSTTTVVAEDNYWGSVILGTISGLIHDRLDDSDNPLVDYIPFNDAAGVTVPLGSALAGEVSDASPLTANTTYQVIAPIVVPSGATLTVPEGVTFEFDPATAFLIEGTIDVQGVNGNPVTFSSSSGTPARGDWPGIEIKAASTGATFDWMIIEYAETAIDIETPANAVITNSTIREFSVNGVAATALSNLSLTDSLIDNTSGAVEGDGLNLLKLTGIAIIQDNEIRGVATGINLIGASIANVTGNDIWGNENGILLAAKCCPTVDPSPTITGNRLHLNSVYNLTTGGIPWADPSATLSFSNNYWGTTNVQQIAQSIRDLGDDEDNPLVDFFPFVDNLGVTVVTGNILFGFVDDSNTTISSGSTWEVVPPMVVVSGETLTIPDDVTLNIGGGTAISVHGTLDVNGLSGTPVRFTSVSGTPARSDWEGIRINPSSTGSNIDWAVIEYTNRAVEVIEPASLTVANTLIREFSLDGIFLQGAANVAISDSRIDNSAGTLTGDGLDLNAVTGTVSIQDSEITGVTNGIYARGSSSVTITGCELWENRRGIHLRVQSGQEPSAVMTDNKLHTNTDYNLYLGTITWLNPAVTVIDAEDNYWGTVEPSEIGATIFDRLMDLDLPLVDYTPFNDSNGQTVTIGTALVGLVSDVLTPLTADTDYDVVGAIIVPNGETLTVPEGVNLRFDPGLSLTVEGTLNVQGLNGNPVTFTAKPGSPARGDWTGIEIETTSPMATFNYAILEFADIAIDVTSPASVTINDSTIREFATSGIVLSAASGLAASDTTIDNFAGAQAGTGISLTGVSGTVTIQNSFVLGTSIGINVVGLSTASITGTDIHDNDLGIVLKPSGGVEPTPTISSNKLFNNSTYNLSTTTADWSAPFTTFLDLTGNYWGDLDPQLISATIRDLGDDLDNPLVDFIPFNDVAGTPVAAPPVLFGYVDDGNTTLVASTTYEVVTPLVVPVGQTLTMPVGVTFEMGADSQIVAAGTLDVQGASGAGNQVSFTSINGTPARGDWKGIVITGSGGSSVLDYAVVEHVIRGVETLDPAAPTISNSLIREWSDSGIRFTDISGQPGVGGSVSDSVVDNYDGGSGNTDGYGIFVDDNAAVITLQSNTIRGASVGLYARRSSPLILDNIVEYNATRGIDLVWDSAATVTGNEISNNDIGIRLTGAGASNGMPVPAAFNSNKLENNNSYNLRINGTWTGVAVIDGELNYWGSITPAVIEGTIYDQIESAGLPLMDYDPFNDSNGNPVP